jgi:hypothetical protein
MYKMVFLLWAMRRLIGEKNVTDQIQRILPIISSNPELMNDEERARILLMLLIAERNDPALNKKIGKRLKKILKSAPGIMDAILPPPKTGFRKNSSQGKKG